MTVLKKLTFRYNRQPKKLIAFEPKWGGSDARW